jgi:hypothetical protein
MTTHLIEKHSKEKLVKQQTMCVERQQSIVTREIQQIKNKFCSRLMPATYGCINDAAERRGSSNTYAIID